MPRYAPFGKRAGRSAAAKAFVEHHRAVPFSSVATRFFSPSHASATRIGLFLRLFIMNAFAATFVMTEPRAPLSRIQQKIVMSGMR